MKSHDDLPQEWRLAAAAGYLVLLVPLSLLLNGLRFPEGNRGILLGLVVTGLAISKLLQEPHFTSPAAGVANGAALILVALGIDSGGLLAGWVIATVRWAVFGYGALALVLGGLAITKRNQQVSGYWFYRLASTIGQATLANSVALFGVALLTYADSPIRLAAVQWFWLAAVVAEPVERVLAAILSRQKVINQETGYVVKVEDPALAVVSFPKGSKLTLGQYVSLGEPKVDARIVEVSQILGEPQARVHVPRKTAIAPGGRVTTSVTIDEAVVGHVTERTDLDEVVLDVVASASERGLAEERLVEVPVGAERVLYQVVSAEIREEASSGTVRNLLRVMARKLGVWNATGRRFETVPWLPAPDAPVVLVARADTAFELDAIGHVPGTNYGLGIDIHAAVTHNTAILGILGVGKTTLAIELVRRMANERIKVIILDITAQYGPRLARLIGATDENAVTNGVNAVTQAIDNSNAKYVYRDGEAGSTPELRTSLRAVFDAFLADDARSVLLVNPNAIRATRIEGFPRGGRVDQVAPMTAAEVTRIIAELLLELAQIRDVGRTEDERREQRAHYCVILEEAHSLVPEFNSVTSKAEEHAVAGTARALLQGRKYGLGAVVITQRTANVTKSILNQCNTVFAMRVFDNTGMEFLANYIGRSYSKLLAVMQDHHAVFFGRGSHSRAPVVVQLNHPDNVDAAFATPVPANLTDAAGPAEAGQTE